MLQIRYLGCLAAKGLPAPGKLAFTGYIHRYSQQSRPPATGTGSDSALQTAFKFSDEDDDEVRYRGSKNPVIPDVRSLNKRWNTMDANQQDDVIAYLEDKMRGDWHELTTDEKLATHYIYYGPWGPRDPVASDPGAIYGTFAKFMGALLGGIVLYRLAFVSTEESEQNDK